MRPLSQVRRSNQDCRGDTLQSEANNRGQVENHLELKDTLARPFGTRTPQATLTPLEAHRLRRRQHTRELPTPSDPWC